MRFNADYTPRDFLVDASAMLDALLDDDGVAAEECA